MDATVSIHALRPAPSASMALKLAARFWFLVVVAGQLLFAVSVAAYYSRAAGRGDFDAWNRVMTHGYVPDEPLGNAAVGVHLVAAVIVILGGALQLLPQIRRHAPAFHRWNGRIYFVAAFAVSIAGLYMMWVRGTVGDLTQHVGQSLDAVLILVFAVLALRAALARDFRTHGRWAMRLYLVVSASLFLRAGLILAVPLGIPLGDGTGAFFTAMAYAQYLAPLGVLELYWRARDHAGAPGRIAMAAGLSLLTVLLGFGIAGATVTVFVPPLQLAYANRNSIAQPLALTLASSGAGPAVVQYHDIKTADPTAYNFAEPELNRLGYKLLKAEKFSDAILIFQLNVEAYPGSGNVYDSLAEAYMDNGDKALAIANYEKALQFTPGSGNAIRMLAKLNAP